MTGPSHYREAERLLASDPACTCERTDCPHGAVLIAEAQVHATLALAAATALHPPAAWAEWQNAAGEPAQ